MKLASCDSSSRCYILPTWRSDTVSKLHGIDSTAIREDRATRIQMDAGEPSTVGVTGSRHPQRLPDWCDVMRCGIAGRLRLIDHVSGRAKSLSQRPVGAIHAPYGLPVFFVEPSRAM